MTRFSASAFTFVFTFAAGIASAETASTPFFGGAMTGIYRPAGIPATNMKQALANPQDCSVFDCPQAHKAPLSRVGQKLLP